MTCSRRWPTSARGATARGRAAYEVAQCAACHKMADTPAAGGVGPDLTAVAARIQRRDILESILEPSKVISEQFANTIVRTRDGDAMRVTSPRRPGTTSCFSQTP